MIEKYYTCVLLSDVVLNASLATEGNMETLDYIPGSNFLGIIAKKYKDFGDKAYDIFHSGKVKFGNAYLMIENKASLPVPLDLLSKKGENDNIPTIYLNHAIDHSIPNIKDLQLKTISGYINISGKIQKDIEGDFSLKSAYDPDNRRSKEGQMFGFKSLSKGQNFLFSVVTDTDELSDIIDKNLTGKHRIGKSKTAEFGHVNIAEVKNEDVINFKTFHPENYNLVYAASNLCFYDEQNGQPTFIPTAKQLGLESGTINWSKSTIRTYSYSPWNNKRGTSDAERHCIRKGSVFFVEGGTVNSSTNYVGAYQNEGVGKVIYNPKLLEANMDGSKKSLIEKFSKENQAPIETAVHTTIGKMLLRMKSLKNADFEIAKAINDELNNFDFEKVKSSSQWGRVRSFAEEFILCVKENGNEQLAIKLKYELEKGHASEKFWDKNNGRIREKLIVLAKAKGPVFIAKLASEVAKKINKNK